MGQALSGAEGGRVVLVLFLVPPVRRRRTGGTTRESRLRGRVSSAAADAPPRPSGHAEGEDEPKEAEGRSQIGIRGD